MAEAENQVWWYVEQNRKEQKLTYRFAIINKEKRRGLDRISNRVINRLHPVQELEQRVGKIKDYYYLLLIFESEKSPSMLGNFYKGKVKKDEGLYDRVGGIDFLEDYVRTKLENLVK